MRLYRPHIPIEVKCRVAMRQIGEDADAVIKSARRCSLGLGHVLDESLMRLADQLKCKTAELRLDHDPPLGARPKHRKGLGKKTYYIPDANDPDHLFYRPHGPEHEGSHLIKTNVRGDHGQHPDRVLIKRERRRTKDKRPKHPGQKYWQKKRELQSRGFDKTRTRGVNGKVRKRT